MKYHGFMAIEQHAVLAVPLDCTRQHAAFGVLPKAGQVFDGVAVIDPRYILLDDGAFVQMRRDIVGGRAYEFDAAIVRLVIGLGAFEARQKAVVNIDGAAFERAAHAITQDLHIACQDHQLGTRVLDDGQLLCFGLGFIRRHRNVVKRNAVVGCQLRKIAVVADDGAYIDIQEARLPAKEQIIQAMPLAADHQHRGHGRRLRMQARKHLKWLGKSRQFLLEALGRHGATKTHTHKKQARIMVVVLRSFFNIAAALKQKSRNGMDDANAVEAREGQNIGGGAGAIHNAISLLAAKAEN